MGESGAREDEKNDTVKWQEDENSLMGEDSYEMRMGKMSKRNTLTDRWGGEMEESKKKTQSEKSW